MTMTITMTIISSMRRGYYDIMILSTGYAVFVLYFSIFLFVYFVLPCLSMSGCVLKVCDPCVCEQ